jgi:hypothetical protein
MSAIGIADWLPELTDDDLTTLAEAMEAWESKDLSGEMLGDVLGAMLVDRRDVTAKAKYEEEHAREQLKRDRVKAVRKERSVVIRAKLLTLRERRRVERAIADRPQLKAQS